MIRHRLTTGLCLCSMTAFLAGATLLAQNPGSMPSQPQQPQQQQPTQPNSPSSDASQGAAATPQNLADQAFVSDAMEGNMAEVELAQLAQQKSQSQDVKQFAQKMAADHEQMNQKWFDPMAKQLNMSQPKGPSKKDKKEAARLQGLSGDEFDKQYITLMVKDHQQDLKRFKQEAEASQDPTLKQVAQQGANVISQHLQLAEQVAKNHNIPLEGNEVSSK